MKTVAINWFVLINNPNKCVVMSRDGKIVNNVVVLEADGAMSPKVLEVTFANGHKSILDVKSWGWNSQSGFRNDVISMMVQDDVVLEVEPTIRQQMDAKKATKKPAPMTVKAIGKGRQVVH